MQEAPNIQPHQNLNYIYKLAAQQKNNLIFHQ